MAYVKFKDSEEFLPAVVIPTGNNTVKITTDTDPDLSGFRLYLRDNDEYPLDNGEYEAYTTLYRQGDGWYELSNDGSEYKPPEPTPEPEPYVPTLEELQESKVSEMNAFQQAVIQSGIDVTLTDGSSEHFTLSDHDQTSLMGLQTQIASGVEQIPWHTADQSEHCKYYSNADMALIVQSAMAFVTWHVTYFRDLRIYIRSLETKEEVAAVTYGMDIPEEYQSEPLKDMIAAQSA